MAIELEVSARVSGGVVGRASDRMLAVAALFGLDLKSSAAETLVEKLRLELSPGDVVLIRGPSGSGKSVLLRELRRAMGAQEPALKVFDLGAVELPGDRALVDCLELPLDGALRILSQAGLSEARLLLRAPARLSEGEAFRFRVARFLASDADVLVADEFCALLDRVTARVAAWQLGRFVRGSVGTARPRVAIVATSHADLCEDLNPSMVIRKGFGSEVEIVR